MSTSSLRIAYGKPWKKQGQHLGLYLDCEQAEVLSLSFALLSFPCGSISQRAES